MYSVKDNFLPMDLISDLQAYWPREDDSRWLRYRSPGEIKLTMRDNLPPFFADTMLAIDRHCPSHLRADTTRHGAGLHHMPIGGFLDPHLDCDVHPFTGHRRAQNAILFLDDFQPDWGGDLHLYDADLSGRADRITPRAGRLVVFECHDESFHGVPGPICGPIPRRSLAVYWWQPVAWQAKRPRAQFVALANEIHNPEKDAWRIARSAAMH